MASITCSNLCHIILQKCTPVSFTRDTYDNVFFCQVTTTIRTKGKNVAVRPYSAPDAPSNFHSVPGNSKAQASLNMLKDLKKIQSTLRKDDITWDD